MPRAFRLMNVDHVVLISIDGFRPEFCQDESWPAPTLQQLAWEGAYAGKVRIWPIEVFLFSEFIDQRLPGFELSRRVGERVLLPAVRAAADDTIIIADGFGCREQIRQLTSRRASHLAEVVRSGLQ